MHVTYLMPTNKHEDVNNNDDFKLLQIKRTPPPGTNIQPDPDNEEHQTNNDEEQESDT